MARNHMLTANMELAKNRTSYANPNISRIGMKGVRRTRSKYTPHQGKNITYTTDADGSIKRHRISGR